MILQTDILEELKNSSDEYQHAILGTFNFDPDFFEWKVLPILQNKDAETILVLTDKKEYENRFSDMSRAGQEYYIDYCYASQTFHPKFILLVWSEGIKLFLGSANLTRQAWFESAEMIGTITYSFSEPDKETEKILSDFRDFLSELITKNYLKSQKHGLKIIQIIEKIPKAPKFKSNTNLIHNLEKPILDQVKDIIGEKITSVNIVAPFFNAEGSVFDFFVNAGCKEFNVFIQPSKVTGFPKEKIKKIQAKGIKINVNQIEFKESENRFIHAKITIIKTATKAYCLYGSANPTFSGMISTPNKGNLEICVLVSNTNLKHYDTLIANDNLSVSDLPLDQIQITPDESKSSSVTHSDILDSYLDGKSLILERDVNTESFKIILGHTNEEFLEIIVKSKDLKLCINLNDIQYDFCSKPTFVYIQYNDAKNSKSNKRWLSTQTIELTPRKMDIERIQKSYGRFGLISFLNKLEKFSEDSDWFYYLLQRVKFEKLSTLESIRRKLAQRKYENEDDVEYERVSKIDLVTNFKNKFQKNNKTVKETLRTISKIEIMEFDKIFNQFLAWSKVEIWFATKNEMFIDNLRFIRSNIEEILIFYNRLKQNKEFKNHLEKIQFWHHLFLFAYLIYQFQKNAGFLQKNKGVVKVFSDTTREIIQNFKEEHKEIEISEMDLALKEYEEFEDLEIDLIKMERVFREEFESKVLKIR